MSRTCDCLDAWRLQTPPIGFRASPNSGASGMICDVCGFIIDSRPSRPHTPQKNSPRTPQVLIREVSPLNGAMTIVSPPQTPLNMTTSSPLFFPSVPPSSEAPPTFLMLQEARKNSTEQEDNKSNAIKPQDTVRLRTRENMRRRSNQSSSSMHKLSNDETAGMDSMWRKLREPKTTSPSRLLPRSVGSRKSSRVVFQAPQSANLQLCPPSPILAHMERFDHPPRSQGTSSKFASTCSLQCQPGPPVPTAVESGLLVLGHHKTSKSPCRSLESPHGRRRASFNTAPIGIPFNMSASPLISPIPPSCIPEGDLVIPTVEPVQTLNPKPSNKSSYWALDLKIEEQLRISTATTSRSRSGGDSASIRSVRSHVEMDGNSTLASLSTCSSFRQRGAQSSGYTEYQKQFPRSALLWPTADPDGTHRPAPPTHLRR
mmetsp:Transcript_35225/g.41553  ORF Transcript_35225/g.41553 Transcript_35225/m.41553 type:complete len:429 (+) Transcript_35225:76-1362(+)